MKRHSSRFLKTIALCYMGFPLLYIALVAVLFDIPAARCVSILLSPSYYALSLVAIAAGYGLREMHRWGWYVFLGANALTLYANALLASNFGQSHHRLGAFFVFMALIVAATYRVTREVRVPYFLPRIRWWESDPRFRLAVPAKVRASNGEDLAGEILDLSPIGCFVKLRPDLKMEEPVIISFRAFGLSVECPGTVVWRTQSTVTVPRGVGLKFGYVTRAQRKRLRGICSRIRKITQLYRSGRYLLSMDELNRRLELLHRSNLEDRE